jgi:hypothetical protein
VSYENSELNKFRSESVWCQIKTASNSVTTVGVCYKSPTAEISELEALYAAIRKASTRQVMIMGDFNFPGINWETNHCDAASEQFRNLIMANFLHQHVKTPT